MPPGRENLLPTCSYSSLASVLRPIALGTPQPKGRIVLPNW